MLENILVDDPVFVCNELKENIKQQLAADEDGYFRRLTINHDVERIYKRLLETHKVIGIQLLADILNCVYDATDIKIDGSEIHISTEFISFQRHTIHHIGSNVVEDITNILIDEFLENAQSEQTGHFLKSFSQSNHGGIVFIALYVYTQRPDLFKENVYEIITQRNVLSNAPAWVEYQAVEALKVSFPLMNDEQKIAVINRILSINDIEEKYAEMDAHIKQGFSMGIPFLILIYIKGWLLKLSHCLN